MIDRVSCASLVINPVDIAPFDKQDVVSDCGASVASAQSIIIGVVAVDGSTAAYQ